MSLPERLGRLRRVDRIGAGGFATVWLYHDDELDSPVAVKALADNWAQRQDVCDRFLEEARILRRADSDHVVRVYDIGAVDGTPYFVMSYADRGTVADLLQPGVPMPADRVVDLMAQAGDGIAVLHRHGVIHRDIKPQNLLLRSTPDGGERVLVADLGVAKAMLHASGLTQVVGTPSYMAPEQANGVGLDLRADVHALGAVAYHLLTGRLVREGGFSSLMQPELPAAPSLIADVAPAYDSVVLRALAVDPDDRWPDVPSFVAGLRWAERTAVQREALTGTAERRLGPPQAVPTQLPTQDRDEPAVTIAPERPAAPAAPATPPEPPRGRRILPLALLSLLVLLVTFGAAYGATRLLGGSDDGEPRSPSSAPSSSPTPTPSQTPLGEPEPDIDFPALQLPNGQEYDTHVVRTSGVAWTYPVPVGWVAYRLGAKNEDLGVLPDDEIDDVGQVRWRPAGEPLVGGFSVRLRALSTPIGVPATLAAKVVELEKLKDPDVYDQTADTVYYTYRDGNNRVRYNFFRWLPNDAGEAALEISVSGRTADKQGLADLLEAVTDGASVTTPKTKSR